MLIKDVCRKCMLTKKAIEYYEKQGLIQPEIDENGYRNFTNKDIEILKEVSVLRKLGISIADIKFILHAGDNKAAALTKCKHLMELRLEKASAQYEFMEKLISNYDIEQGIDYVQTFDDFFTIKEKLIQAFPGSYGMYLNIHFGRFLNEKIDTIAKEEAYNGIINYLDGIENFFTAELEEYLDNYFSIIEKADMEKINSMVLNAIDNVEEFIESNKKTVEEYLEVRASEEFKKSPAYKLQQLLIQFQQQSGYCDVFLSNLKILSTSYRDYTNKLEAANKKFMKLFPQYKNSC